MRPIIIAVVLLFGGFWSCSKGREDRRILAQYEKEGDQVTGEILEGEIERISRRELRHVLKVRYTTLDGKLFNKRFTVTKSFYKSARPEATVTVRYLKDSPSDSFIEGGTSLSPSLQWVGTLTSVAALGYLAYRFRQTLRDDN
jgi:hypothetical protein